MTKLKDNKISIKIMEEENKYSKLLIEDTNKVIETILWHDDEKQNYWIGLPKKEIMTELAYPTDEFWNASQLKRVLKNKEVATLIARGICIFYSNKEYNHHGDKLC